MAHSHGNLKDEKLELGAGAGKVYLVGQVVGVIGVLAALGISLTTDLGLRRFYFAYLMAFAFFMSFAVGGLFFVLLQYCVRAGWSVNVRRVPEAFARTLPLFAILSIPLLFTIFQYNGALYRWAQPIDATVNAHHDHHEGQPFLLPPGAPAVGWAPFVHASFRTELADSEPGANTYAFTNPFPVNAEGKPIAPDTYLVGPKKSSALLLNSWAVIARVIGFLVVLSMIAYWYTSASRKQDQSGDLGITERLSIRSAPMLVVFGVAVTSLAFDLFMSLDPTWYSTIFGGYYFAGSAICVMAGTILTLKFLQSKGYLHGSVTTEHYHDLGKFQFAFTFFWGYIAFSQFMLLWYASLPETAHWLARRGASTAMVHQEAFGGWTVVSLMLLFGKLLIPFAGLLSRHVKRNPFGLTFWAGWILVFHAVDMFWLIGPELNGKVNFGLPEVAAFVGIGGFFLAVATKQLSGALLRPVKDPRASESLAFHQSF